MARRSLYLVILTLCASAPHFGQEDYIRFKRLTVNDGLSLNSVYTVYQDSKGFLWFGTEDGLNRYDGQSVTVYGATTETHDILASKWIELIYEDKSGMIWLGSRGGLTRYNPRKGLFTALTHEPDESASLSNDTVTAIIADLRNDVWIGTNQGLNKVDRITSEVERITPVDSDLQGLMSGITGFLQDRSGTLWIATRKGLYSYDTKSGLFFNETADGLIMAETEIRCIASGTDAIWIGTGSDLVRLDLSGAKEHRLFSPEFEESGAAILSLLEDRLGQLWMMTNRGLYLHRPSTGRVQKFLKRAGETHSLALNPVEPLVEDSKGQIWYGSFGNGAFQIDPESLDYRHFTHNPADPQSISENTINCIFEDRSGAIWFGTFGAGVSILDPQANKFTIFKHDPFDPNSLASSFVWTVFETSDSVVWCGSDAHGISCYDRKNGKFTQYTHDPADPSTLSHPSVRKIYQDSRGRIWIGTDGGGLDRFLPGSNTFLHHRHDPEDPSSISHNSVRAIYEDRSGRIWIGTRNGLNRYVESSGTFKRYLHDLDDPASLSNNFIYSAIYEDDEGQLWIGTYGGGLCRMDPETGHCLRFAHDPDDPTTIADNIVYSVYEDDLGRFWIGTNNGLNMFYPATGSFRRFGVGEGLANEVVYGILPDRSNHIWISTNMGITRFDLETFEAKNFDMSDGLQSNEFNGGAYHRGHGGMLYFGGVYGLNRIDPASVQPERNVTEVTLTKLEVMGAEVQVAGIDIEEAFFEHPNRIIAHEGDYYCGENITYMEEIVLDYKHRFFSIEYSALNTLQPGKLSYLYRMENLESDWNNAGSRNYVSYANISPGSYTLEVVAENADGYRSDPPLRLDILVRPPFWQSWWFIALEVLLASSIAVMIYNYLVKSRTNRLLKVQNRQISEANRALRESEKNLMELNATKDKFFSIISHDLKNPFSSLLSISELMVDNFDHADREEHRAGFRKIHEAVKQLLDLLENLLTWSRSQRGRIKYEPVRFNLTSLVRENINLHKLPAEKKGVQLLPPGDREIYAHADRDMINSVVRNLMTNAVKFTGSQKKVEVKLEPRDGRIEVSIEDEGVGIPAELSDKLFRIDEKIKSTGTAGEKGTGLGLIICREFVEKNGGEIRFTSTPGEGSTFTFTVPMAN